MVVVDEVVVVEDVVVVLDVVVVVGVGASEILDAPSEESVSSAFCVHPKTRKQKTTENRK